ncbi:MAG: pilus assembly protein [Proteobacteria bacterium]|nr:pilus assembly protein [Pseudomonadota bacterium]NOG59743.1 pilus assembly protein [Pseudomonadota bacterium]
MSKTMTKNLERHSGQSMVEFIIVTPIILLLLLGAFQFALIYHAKITLNYAAFETARTGAVANARMSEMENAFARAMAAIHTHDDTSDDVMCGREIVYQEIENNFVNIEIINPPAAAFDDNNLDPNGDDTIPNDNLMYRNAISDAGLTIQDANLLKIRVSYCYPMYVPYINRAIGIMLTNPLSNNCPGCTGLFNATGTFERGCLDNGRFPIHSQAIVRMQSAASLDAINTGLSGGGYISAVATTTREPFYQCDDVGDHSVKDTSTPPDITTQTGYWTLSAQTPD